MENECLPDIQCSLPNIKIPIQQVGVENVEVPLKEFSLTPSFGERYKLKKALPIIFDVLNLDVSGEENGTKKVR